MLAIGTSLTIMYAYCGLGNLPKLTNVGGFKVEIYAFISFALSLLKAENTRLEKISVIKFDAKDEIYLILSQI